MLNLTEENADFLRLPTIGECYSKLSDHVMQLSEIGQMTIMNLETPGFMVTSFTVNQSLTEMYQSFSHIQGKVANTWNLDGVNYGCVGMEQVKLGTDLVRLLKEDQPKILRLLDSLESSLKTAIDVVTLIDSSIERRQLRVQQFQDELKHLNASRVGIISAFRRLQNTLLGTYPIRNQLTVEEYPGLFHEALG